MEMNNPFKNQLQTWISNTNSGFHKGFIHSDIGNKSTVIVTMDLLYWIQTNNMIQNQLEWAIFRGVRFKKNEL